MLIYTVTFEDDRYKLDISNPENVFCFHSTIDQKIVELLSSVSQYLKTKHGCDLYRLGTYPIKYSKCGFIFATSIELNSNQVTAFNKFCKLMLGTDILIELYGSILSTSKLNLNFQNVNNKCINFMTITPESSGYEYINNFVTDFVEKNIIQKLSDKIQHMIKNFEAKEFINLRGRQNIIGRRISHTNLTNVSIHFKEDLTDTEFEEIKTEIKRLNSGHFKSNLFVQFDKINDPQYPIF